jgi:hypothetical protein
VRLSCGATCTNAQTFHNSGNYFATPGIERNDRFWSKLTISPMRINVRLSHPMSSSCHSASGPKAVIPSKLDDVATGEFEMEALWNNRVVRSAPLKTTVLPGRTAKTLRNCWVQNRTVGWCSVPSESMPSKYVIRGRSGWLATNQAHYCACLRACVPSSAFSSEQQASFPLLRFRAMTNQDSWL